MTNTNLEKAERLRLAQDALETEIAEFEAKAKELGWNVGRHPGFPKESYANFLEKLLAAGEVVKTGDVRVMACDHFEVGPGEVLVDARLYIERVFAYLKE